MVRVQSFRFDRNLTGTFLRFEESLYRGDPNRIPPFRRNRAGLFKPSDPFHRKEGNDHRHFLAFRDGRVAGRVTAMVNAALKDEDGARVGLVGFFECLEDEAAAAALLDNAREWLAAEHGLRKVWGPVDFDTWHGYRFLTGGFDGKPFYGEPDNKPYYPALFEHCGFVRRRTWDSLEVIGRDRLEALAARGGERCEDLIGRGYRFEPLEKIDSRRDLPLIHDLISRTFDGFLGFTPIPFDEFKRLFGRMRLAVACPMSLLVYDDRKRLAGYSLTYYDIAEAVRAMNGRLTLLGAVKFLALRRRSRRLIFFAGGVTPEERERGPGLGRAGLTFVIRQALRHGYDDILFALMSRENPVQNLFRGIEPDARREYALYESRR